jgi:hypothetical protein
MIVAIYDNFIYEFEKRMSGSHHRNDEFLMEQSKERLMVQAKDHGAKQGASDLLKFRPVNFFPSHSHFLIADLLLTAHPNRLVLMTPSPSCTVRHKMRKE